MKMRWTLAIAVLLLCGSAIGAIFWKQELQYALPTPVPVGYAPVLWKEQVQLPLKSSGPLFIHFFNPDCPCSRFNKKYFNQLVYNYRDKIEFLVVIPPYASLDAARAYFDRAVRVVVDDAGWAKATGVYATPQAVIVDGQSNLYYRGNYNRTRYCTDPETNYAEMALQALLDGKPAPLFDAHARQAYGCSFEEEPSL
jgi:hypothetical protein